MPIRFSEHALVRMKARKISKTLVLETLRNPREIIVSFRGRKLRQKRFGGKILEVVTMSEGTTITMITAYYLRGDQK